MNSILSQFRFLNPNIVEAAIAKKISHKCHANLKQVHWAFANVTRLEKIFTLPIFSVSKLSQDAHKTKSPTLANLISDAKRQASGEQGKRAGNFQPTKIIQSTRFSSMKKGIPLTDELEADEKKPKRKFRVQSKRKRKRG